MLQYTGWSAEWSKALVIGTTHFGVLAADSHSSHFVDIPIKTIAACIWHICSYYLLPSWMTLISQYTGRIGEWSKALFLGTSLFGGVDSSSSPIILLIFL